MKAMKGLLTNFVCPPAQKWINDKLLKKTSNLIPSTFSSSLRLFGLKLALHQLSVCPEKCILTITMFQGDILVTALVR